MATSSEDALKAEIQRLTGAINRYKSGTPSYVRSNTYVNPNYKPPPRIFPKTSFSSQRVPAAFAVARSQTAPSTGSHPREVVIDGVTFQSSRKSLIRKDLAKPISSTKPTVKPISHRHDQHSVQQLPHAGHRPYKVKTSRYRNRNMTLANGRKPSRLLGQKSVKSMKSVNKQCSRFSATGVCSRGRICPYQHDPTKIAICWPFLQGTCPNAPETCSLSHDPTFERTPLCVHFANNGRCKNAENCLFPHVRVGPRKGVCRDFAVLGYCEKGINCEYQHVRECPDFAEKGSCPNPRCKLPHVIRASQRRKSSGIKADAEVQLPVASKSESIKDSSGTDSTSTDSSVGVEPQIGDEFISLTFHESEESEVSEDDEDEDEDEEEEDESSTDTTDDASNMDYRPVNFGAVDLKSRYAI